MKPSIFIAVFVLIFGLSLNGRAQTMKYVTLYSYQNNAQYALQTNQIVSVVGTSYANNSSPSVRLHGGFPDGSSVLLLPSSPGSIQMITGLTNVALSWGTQPTWATFQITTPASANVISNYVPADAIVIPTSATGNVQIILESSADLVNWTAASPGTYSASSATNRFFRVRAVHN